MLFYFVVGNRIYHVLEPLNSESQLCSLCNKPLQEEQGVCVIYFDMEVLISFIDSMYLVILPDQHKDVHDKSDTTDNTGNCNRIFYYLSNYYY